MIRFVRLVHRLFRLHRFEPATLTLAGLPLRVRACRCGQVDVDAGP